MHRLLAAAGVLIGLGGGPARACPVATLIEVRNMTQQQILRIDVIGEAPARAHVPADSVLPPAGMAPGAIRTVGLPSCLGTYLLTAVLMDGTERRYPGLQGAQFRGQVVEVR
jgi:hypothetical protein